MSELDKDISFILEVEKMKSIYRKSTNLSNNRRENDAEHTYYVAITAMILNDYAENNIDINKVIKMLLVHDLVEIDAGDTFAYDKEGYKTKYEREQKAAQRIFGMLSDDKINLYKNLYYEFENCTTEESKFANLIDRISPILLNYFNKGGTWKEYNINKEMVLNRIKGLQNSSHEIYSYISDLLDDYFD